MDEILHKLYHGGVFPAEQILSRDPEYRSVNGKISEERRYFEDKLSASDCTRLEELETLYMQSSSLQEEAAFCYGFKLGISLLLAVYTE